MKKIFLISVLLGISITACKKQDTEEVVPACIAYKIQDFKSYSCDTGATVNEYSFQGKLVYVFDPGTCGADLSSDVFDSECNYLGFLGGIAGITKINGEEFSNAIFQKTVWKE